MKEVKLMIDDYRDRCNVITALVNAGYEIKMAIEAPPIDAAEYYGQKHYYIVIKIE